MPNLVGIGLSQVPTNSMLGGLAYQDPEHASIKDLDLKNLSQINSEINDTASAIFVYDTRKDSDGGAWRKRTQHTSWYNETLGTVGRGTRKEFPAVAVIVAENDALTIYDGDDPDLPMWMKWTTTTMLRGNAARALAAKNGIIAITNASTYGGLVKIYFISDTAKSYRAIGSNNNSEGYWIGPGIESRNDYSSNNYSNSSGGNTLPALVSEYTNDVAMTVLPNAPIDDDTGLPIPTIAVATNGGVSIIKDNGSVVDIVTSSATYDDVNNVQFTKDNKIVYTEHSGVYYGWMYVHDIPSSDTTITLNSQSSALSYYDTRNPLANFGQEGWIRGSGIYQGDRIESLAVGDGLHIYAAPRGNSGVTFIEDNRTADKSSLMAYVTKDFNTGWMHGDIKGAFLSDTDTTNVTGSEKIANHDFSADFSTQWQAKGNAITSYDATNDRVTVTSTQNYSGIQLKSASLPTLTQGKRYIMTVDIHSINNPIRFGVVSGGTKDNVNSTGAHTFIFTAQASVTEVFVEKPSGSNSTFVLNSVSIREAEEDRSVNNNGLQVFGTVPKQVVATGADLVSYGPFNNNNYLRQPVNSDLAFVQNDFSIMFWVYDTGINQHCTLISRDEREFDISRLANAYGNKLRIYTRNFNGDLRAPDSTSALPQNRWTCVCVVYTGGNTKRVYIDGVLDRLITGTDGEYEIDNSTQYALNIGVRSTGGVKNYSADGVQLALMRISGSAPSAAQVKKMYEDEKVLFQENAKATLYGSSDVVKALAYDDSTNLLYAGTSAGRSEFQGLRRINNTTEAVTTAISASNGLVAEQ